MMQFAREPYTTKVTLTLSDSEKGLLVQLAEDNGSTMRGYLRKLIRDAARHNQKTTRAGAGEDIAQTIN